MSSVSTTTSAAASPTHTATSGGPGDSQSRPLLFFVALGFGVVFTNLWIIVGVKYCFRYNQRARQLAALDADGGDGLDLHAMPRPRRRREKKLMTMEDVNARFPLTKYKLWRALRETQGMSANGGVTAPPSRAASIKETIGLGRVSTEDGLAPHRKETTVSLPVATGSGQQPLTSDKTDFAVQDSAGEGPSSPNVHEKQFEVIAGGNSADPTATNAHAATTVEDDLEDDDDDPIRTAVPTELIAEPGDACAICIDTLEDDDEVRGLTCGHAFHAACLDPWLTSRRACCPLCKAEYYIPKPRTEGEAQREEMERRPPMMRPANAWAGGRYLFTQVPPAHTHSRVLVGGSRFNIESDRYGFPVLTRESRASRRRAQQQQQQAEGASELTQQTEGGAEGGPSTQVQSSWFHNAFVNTSRNVPRLPRIPGLGRRQDNAATPTTNVTETTTPAQLEAGTAQPEAGTAQQ